MAAETVKKNPLSKTTKRQAAVIATAMQHPGLSQRAIAKITNTDRGCVSRILQEYGITEQKVDNYVSQRAKIYQGIQAKILSEISQEDIEKAGLRDKCVAAGILHDHERIELGQSTDKQPVLVLVRGDNCNVQIGGKVEQDASANDKMSKLVDITPDDKSLHKLSD
jgi:hypothetical protein